MNLLKAALKSALLVYIGLLISIFFLQRYLVFVPSENQSSPQDIGLAMEEVKLTTSDNTAIVAWYAEGQENMPTILYFHGNAGYIGGRKEQYQAFIDKGLGVLALSYRGYGKSEGEPTEDGIYNDARAAVNYMVQEKNIPSEQIILFGESLGTGVAVQMATEYEVGAVVLQAPYTSIAKVGAERYFYILGAEYMVWDKFDSVSKLQAVDEPLLVIHSEDDTVVPIHHGRELLSAAVEPKHGIFVDGFGHGGFDKEWLAEQALIFYRQYK